MKSCFSAPTGRVGASTQGLVQSMSPRLPVRDSVCLATPPYGVGKRCRRKRLASPPSVPSRAAAPPVGRRLWPCLVDARARSSLRPSRRTDRSDLVVRHRKSLPLGPCLASCGRHGRAVPRCFVCAASVAAGAYERPPCELECSDHAGLVAEAGPDEVVVDRVAELGRVEVAGSQRLDAAANMI
jgi:hypothetical protein